MVIGDYPKLGPLAEVAGPTDPLDAATAALANAFNGQVINAYSEPIQ